MAEEGFSWRGVVQEWVVRGWEEEEATPGREEEEEEVAGPAGLAEGAVSAESGNETAGLTSVEGLE